MNDPSDIRTFPRANVILPEPYEGYEDSERLYIYDPASDAHISLSRDLNITDLDPLIAELRKFAKRKLENKGEALR